ncbi:TSUP family transporter [Methylobacterium sp. CM6257]
MPDLAFAAAIAVVAALYSAVGQAGGTGYVALMGLAGFASETIKPTALALNILVAALACIRFYRARLLTWRACYPFGVLGLPFSLLGGALHLPSATYQPVVGALLLAAGLQMLRGARTAVDKTGLHPPPFLAALLMGGVIGVVSGVTGVGGGIFLAPAILTLGWADTRQTAAISATFNLINSAAALAGAWATMPALPAALPFWLACGGGGGLAGSWLGARHLRPRTLRLLLAALLLASAVRMIATSL